MQFERSFPKSIWLPSQGNAAPFISFKPNQDQRGLLIINDRSLTGNQWTIHSGWIQVIQQTNRSPGHLRNINKPTNFWTPLSSTKKFPSHMAHQCTNTHGAARWAPPRLCHRLFFQFCPFRSKISQLIFDSPFSFLDIALNRRDGVSGFQSLCLSFPTNVNPVF